VRHGRDLRRVVALERQLDDLPMQGDHLLHSVMDLVDDDRLLLGRRPAGQCLGHDPFDRG
jgi:hypothetical protein